MGLKEIIRPFFWAQYSKKLEGLIHKPRSVGFFTPVDATSCALRLVKAESGDLIDGNWVRFYWLVDPNDGIIVDAKFQIYGESILIGLAEAVCGLIVGKNYDQAARLHVEVIDNYLKDRNEQAAFPNEALGHVAIIMESIKKCAHQCGDIPISLNYQAPPISMPLVEGEGYPGFENLNLAQKIAVINQVLDQEVRPYVEMDAGGVEVVGLQGNQITIAYQGNCTSCFSSTGATLSYIQQVIQAKVAPYLQVTPNF